jgi:hypothetical protein
MSLKRDVARTLDIKYIRNSKENTFANAGNENYIVESKAYRPRYLLRSLNSLLTLSTLNMRANYGPTRRNLKLPVLIYAIIISAADDTTTKKSNAFQLF